MEVEVIVLSLAALHLLDRFESEISSLSAYPQRIILTEEEPWHGYGIYKMSVKNFLVYFWIDEDAYKVQVTAVCQQLSKYRKFKLSFTYEFMIFRFPLI